VCIESLIHGIHFHSPKLGFSCAAWLVVVLLVEGADLMWPATRSGVNAEDAMVNCGGARY